MFKMFPLIQHFDFFFVPPKLHKLLSETFAANESDAIINMYNLNSQKIFCFLYCFCFFKESTLGTLPVYLQLSIFRIIYEILYQKMKKCLRKNIISRNKQNRCFNNFFYQYTETPFRASSRVKYPFLLFFVDSITFLFTKSFVKGSSMLSAQYSKIWGSVCNYSTTLTR